MKKKLFAVLCLLMLLSNMGGNVVAAVVQPIAPYWVSTKTAYCSISFSETTGSINYEVIGKAGTTAIIGTVTLYENGILKTQWSINATTRAKGNDEFICISGKTYTLVLDVEVTCNGYTEKIEDEVTELCT